MEMLVQGFQFLRNNLSPEETIIVTSPHDSYFAMQTFVYIYAVEIEPQWCCFTNRCFWLSCTTACLFFAKISKTADNTKIKNLTTIHSKRRLSRHFLALKFRISLTMLRNSGNEEFCCHKLAFVVRDEK